MKSNKIVLVSSLVLALSASYNASAFGLGGLMGGSSDSAKSGDISKDVETFLKTADDAHALTSKSVEVLGEALLTKEEIQKNSESLAAANKIQDPKEREAAIAKHEADVSADLAKVNYEAKSKELAKSNDKKKTSQIGASMYNFVLGLLKDQELAGQGSGLISSVSSNPMMAGKALKVKDVMASISGQLGNMGKIASGLQKLNSVIKTTPLPTSSAAAPVAAAD